MPTLDVRGASFECIEQGSGEPVVLIHGSVSDHRTWARLQPELARRFRAIVYSRRYHWPNAPIPDGADYAMVEQVDDLDALLDAVRARPAHLVGQSYGAYLALLLAIREPESVRRLVLAEPPVLPLFVNTPPKTHELLEVLFRRPRTAAAIIQFGAKGMGPATAAFKRGDLDSGLHLFGSVVLGREAFGRLSRRRMDQVRANLIPAEFLGSGFAPLSDAQVRGITHPTLLLGGERSPKLFGLLMDRLQELIPSVERAEIPGASHILHEDNPGAFLEKVAEFLDSGAA